MSTPSSNASSAKAAGFTLHPVLAADCAIIGDLAICRVLLMKNARFPWLVLVPKRENLRELHDLSASEYLIVMEEIRSVSSRFSALTGAHKMNVAALGNMVPQLHIHVIARFTDDAAWPQPVWNSGISATPYSTQELGELIASYRQNLGLC